ncbi:carbohydrate-binding protein [Dyadobacter sp. CY327]|uniref:carbohydrate-binding protein n=1 Tax=Dyadobacter sp. CY327 TaxID=2907301 RepID=UPI001F1CD2BA|nr:carbohydrate-binding protein [Dyadobacter sp. CY327]MCE7069401.1 carbohydrate-binding protein [Dyadobacter sp. CY327]
MKKILLSYFLFASFLIQAQSYKALPGRVEAEDYAAMNSVGTEATSDADGGQNVGWIQDGSWMDYSVTATVAGYYTFRFRVANGYSPEAALSLKSANGDKLGQRVLPQTGGMQNYHTVNFVVFLPQGNQTLRVYAEKGGFNLNWFEAAASRNVSGRIEAEDFDAVSDVRTETTSDTDGNLNVGYIDDGDFLDYNINLAGGTYTANFRIANSYGSGIIEIKNAAGTLLGQLNVPQTGGWQNWATISTQLTLPSGSQVIHLATPQGAFNFNWFELVPQAAAASGTALPAKIEAESFDASNNVGTETTADDGGGENVGWIQEDSWMEYQINTAESGIYTMSYRVSNGYSPEASFALKKSDGTELGRTTVPQTGGMQVYKTVNMLVSLPAGNETLRVQALKTGWNFNWFEAKASRPLAGKMEAETFDLSSDVRLESTTDTDGGTTVGYIDDGDWLDYNVKIAAAGAYTIGFRVSNSYGNGNIEIKNGAGTVLGSINVPQTGGWNNYNTIRTTVNLPAGSQILRIHANRGAFNLNWFEISAGSVQEQSTITFNEIGDKGLEIGTFDLAASSNNNESPITFTSSNTAVATVSNATGSWKATLVGAGQTTITASQSGSEHFLAAENVSRNLTVTGQSNPTNPTAGAKITLDPKRWYQVTNATTGLDKLFDGDTQTEVLTGWGKVVNYYDAYYPLLDGEQITLEGVKFFDYVGSTVDRPMILSVINDQWQRIPVATFTGTVYNGWVGPYPDRASNNQFNLDAPVSNIRYLVLTLPDVLPTEIEFYGSHTPAAPSNGPTRAKNIRLKDMMGVNGYEWNFQDGAHIESLVEPKVTAAKSFSGFRHYMDWEKLEADEGVFSFNPTRSGSWNYDLIYQRLKQENIEVLACLKTLPPWMLQSYPENERDSENVPVRYGKDFKDPLSYIEQAKVAFQYVARYGSNLNVDPSLLSVSTIPRWTNDPPNEVKIGMNLIKYIECDNERDKWWKGRKGYQTAREYAANMSAFYDGHKNTMGTAVGVKNADPNMKVVIAGMVTGPDYLRGMVDWCKEFRGYRADGSVNLCWDVVNFHLYTDDASSSQGGNSTRGAAPEVTNANVILDNFVKASREVSQDMPVWITEAGYDLHQSSPLKAIPIGNKSAQQTQADWILRTSLFSARHGIEKVFFYQMYDDNPAYDWMFGTSGMINDDFSRRPVTDYFIQTKNLFGDYVYKETIHADPVVDRYELNGKSLFILAVPDEVGRTAEYTLNLGESGIAKVYTPTAGSDYMAVQEKGIVDGKVTVTVTETPIFVIASNAPNARTAAAPAPELTPEPPLHEDVNVFPNPATDFVNVELANESSANVEVKVFDAKTGRLYKNDVVNKSANKLSHKLNLTHMPIGAYIIEVKQGNQSTFRKVAKVH